MNRFTKVSDTHFDMVEGRLLREAVRKLTMTEHVRSDGRMPQDIRDLRGDNNNCSPSVCQHFHRRLLYQLCIRCCCGCYATVTN